MIDPGTDLSKFDWNSLPENAIRELHRQAELCLLGTVSLAADQDQRSTTLCGIFGAIAVALLAALATLVAAKSAHAPVVVAELITSAGLIVASMFCALAAQPSNFHVAGYEPKLLIVSAPDERWMLGNAIRDLQDRIDANRTVLEQAARKTSWGIKSAAISLGLGITAFLLTALLEGSLPF